MHVARKKLIWNSAHLKSC